MTDEMPDDLRECSGCGHLVTDKQVGLSYNIGSGPEYYCNVCMPPVGAKEGIGVIEAFMGKL